MEIRMRRPFYVVALTLLASAHLALSAAPNFSKDVAPVLYNNCVTCHRPGEVAPFPLITYKDVKKHAGDIATVTHDRFMPPWKAVPGHGDFVGERRLTADEIALIKSWTDAGSPEGNPADLPPVPKFADGWHLGEPDLIVKMTESYTVPAEGRDIFRCFVLPLNIDEDKFVTAVEYRPSNRKVVHHALLFLDATGTGRKFDEADPGPGYGNMGGGIGFAPTGGLGGWAPGVFPNHLPDGICRNLRKGSDLIIQVHFHPTGKLEQEQSSVGIYLSKKPPQKILTTIPLRNKKIDIPPGQKDYKVSKSLVLPIGGEVIGIIPHAHLICKDMKVWATTPDGSKRDLIWIDDWDFNWQDQYIYKQSIKFPAGTKFDMEFTYDNSTDNVRNPNNPPQRITHGEQTSNEMAIAFIQMVPDLPGFNRPATDAEKAFLKPFLDRLRQQADR